MEQFCLDLFWFILAFTSGNAYLGRFTGHSVGSTVLGREKRPVHDGYCEYGTTPAFLSSICWGNDRSDSFYMLRIPNIRVHVFGPHDPMWTCVCTPGLSEQPPRTTPCIPSELPHNFDFRPCHLPSTTQHALVDRGSDMVASDGQEGRTLNPMTRSRASLAQRLL